MSIERLKPVEDRLGEVLGSQEGGVDAVKGGATGSADLVGPPTEGGPGVLDMNEIAKRILQLSEIATLEHLEELLNSQAGALMALRGDVDAALYGKKFHGRLGLN